MKLSLWFGAIEMYKYINEIEILNTVVFLMVPPLSVTLLYLSTDIYLGFILSFRSWWVRNLAYQEGSFGSSEFTWGNQGWPDGKLGLQVNPLPDYRGPKTSQEVIKFKGMLC